MGSVVARGNVEMILSAEPSWFRKRHELPVPFICTCKQTWLCLRGVINPALIS